MAGEAACTSAVHALGLPVPAVYGTLDVDGRHGIIFERVDGPDLAEWVRRRPWRVFAAGRRMARLHADMHARSVPAAPCYHELLARRIGGAPDLPAPLREAVLERLGSLPKGDSLCHGDFHPLNILMGPRGPVVIDWDCPARGNPWADVARTLLILDAVGCHAKGPQGMALKALVQALRATYLHVYLRLTGAQAGQLRAWRAPMAAARLREGIDVERRWLLTQVRRHLTRRCG